VQSGDAARAIQNGVALKSEAVVTAWLSVTMGVTTKSRVFRLNAVRNKLTRATKIFSSKTRRRAVLRRRMFGITAGVTTMSENIVPPRQNISQFIDRLAVGRWFAQLPRMAAIGIPRARVIY
jgi:hypothetical protein